MNIASSLHRLADRSPAPLRRMIRSDRMRPVRQLLLPEQPIVTGTVHYEGHTFEFTAPKDELEKAQTRGIENRICRLILSEVPVGSTTVDVGANYGFLTRIMAAATGASGRVVSFEIDPEIADLLTESLATSGTSWVQVVSKGVGLGDLQGLDAFRPALEPVAFLKIDVDGPELDVLKSAVELLERDHPIVVVEINRQAQEIYDLLSAAGYSHFMGMSNEPVVPGTWPQNLIASTRPVQIPRV